MIWNHKVLAHFSDLIFSLRSGEFNAEWKASHLCVRRWQRRHTWGRHQRSPAAPQQRRQGLSETGEGQSGGRMAILHLFWLSCFPTVEQTERLPPVLSYRHRVTGPSALIESPTWNHNSRHSFSGCLHGLLEKRIGDGESGERTFTSEQYHFLLQVALHRSGRISTSRHTVCSFPCSCLCCFSLVCGF